MRNEFCRTVERAFLLAAKYLHECQQYFELVSFDELKTWKETIIGKKVRHGGIPSTVARYVSDGEIIVKRDDGKDYLPDLYPSLMEEDGTYDTEWRDEDRVHITDKRLSWN